MNDSDTSENSSNNEHHSRKDEQNSLLHDRGAMLAIISTVMNFLWIFPSLGALMVFVRYPIDKQADQSTMDAMLVEHWIAVGILFLQLLFLNGWLMTRHLMPKSGATR